MSERYYTPAEAARKLGIGLQRVYMLLADGKIRARKHGQNWRISETEIQLRLQFLEVFNRGRNRKRTAKMQPTQLDQGPVSVRGRISLKGVR
jgi:excisionase family DNA binding protein